MSLINDALKRAKDAHENAEPAAAPALKFRAPEPPRHAAPERLTWVLPCLITAVVLFLVFVVWQLGQIKKSVRNSEQNDSSATASANFSRANDSAKEDSASALLQGKSLKIHARENENGPAPKVAATAPRSALPAPVTEKEAVVQVSPTTVTEVPRRDYGTNSTDLSDSPAKPSGPRLQAILYNPSNPSAMIGGKIVFVGEHVGTFIVFAIGKDSATLVGGGQTNVLTLP